MSELYMQRRKKAHSSVPAPICARERVSIVSIPSDVNIESTSCPGVNKKTSYSVHCFKSQRGVRGSQKRREREREREREATVRSGAFETPNDQQPFVVRGWNPTRCREPYLPNQPTSAVKGVSRRHTAVQVHLALRKNDE